jgi:hypothetical protein
MISEAILCDVTTTTRTALFTGPRFWTGVPVRA